ncbi:actin family [Syncephalis plumigaleata]|nr:actin family [Syncephalis plumigaleata]
MATYGGDEVSALVLDVGASWTKAGYAGEDMPSAFFSSWIGAVPGEKLPPPAATTTNNNSSNNDTAMDVDGADASTTSQNGTSESNTMTDGNQGSKTRYYIHGGGAAPPWHEHMEMRNPMKDGLIDDWEALEQIWDHIFDSALRVNPAEHPLLVTESAWNKRECRERLAELAFEKYRAPAFFLCKDAVLTAFAAGRSTALVVDAGAGTTRVVPVYDGYVMHKNIAKQSLGAHMLSEIILHQMETDINIKVTPQYKVKQKEPVDSEQPAKATLYDRPNTTDSYDHLAKLQVAEDYKETVCQVFETVWDPISVGARPTKTFEFPDGYNRFFGAERLQAPEILFQPENFLPANWPKRDTYRGLPGLVYTSVSGCDVDLRPHLLNNIVVAGGNSLFPGFTDRLQLELSMMAPSSKVRIHAPSNSMERRCGSWQGGSILASLGAFHQMWISRKEFEEQGAQIVDKKCQ